MSHQLDVLKREYESLELKIYDGRRSDAKK